MADLLGKNGLRPRVGRRPLTGPKAAVGDRVRLDYCGDEHTRLESGATGTVTFVDDTGTNHIDWDDGHRLGLVPDAGDRWTVLKPGDDGYEATDG